MSMDTDAGRATRATVAAAIKAFAERVADELDRQAKEALMPESESALQRAAWAVRDAVKSKEPR